MVRKALLVALILPSLVLVPRPAFAVSNGVIGFVQLPKRGDFEIGTMNPNGSNPTARSGGTTAAWSPDGSALAYITIGGPLQEHVVIRAGGPPIDTGVRAQGYDLYTGAGMDWSPDGTRIAYTYQEHIWVMNAGPPYDPVQLIPTNCLGATPSWSPDGSMVAYWGSACMASGLYIINADGTGNHRVPTPAEVSDLEWPDWSPDGSQFAFLGLSADVNGLWVMDNDGTNARLLVATYEFCCGSPSWSPDGTQIAFIGNDGLSTVNADGSGLAVLRPGVQQPNWRARP